MVRPVEEALPFDGALAAGEPEVDDLLPAIVPDPRRHQDRAPGQDLADLAGREPRNEAGRDRTVDLRGTPCGALRNPGRAEVTGARHVAFNRHAPSRTSFRR